MRKTASTIFKLAVPVIVSQLSLTLVQIVDTMFIGRLGPIQLSATALVGILIWNLVNIGEGFSVGLTACIARMIGGKNLKESSIFFRTGMLGITILGIVLIPPLLLFKIPLFTLMRMPPELFGDASLYFSWYVIFLPFVYLLTSVQAAFRAAGDTRTPMLIGFIMNGINVLLDYALIFGKLGFPAMGVQGAAIASGISFIVGWAILFIISSKRGWGPFRAGKIFTFSHFIRIIRLGIPSTLERLSMSISQLMVMAVAVNPLGSFHISSFHIILRLASLSFMPGYGFAISAATLSGQNLGAGKEEEASRLVWHTVFYGALVMGVISVLCYSIPEELVRVFTENREIIALSKTPLRIYAVMAVFLAPAMILGGGLRGAGDTKYPMFMMFFSRFVIRLPLSWLLGIYFGMGLEGVWIAMCSDFFFRAVLLTVRMHKGVWKTISV